MRVCIPVSGDGHVGQGWGRAHRVAVVEIRGGEITRWQEYEVGWDEMHGRGPEGTHHAWIARFLIGHQVDAVVAGHMGPPMQNMLNKMGVRLQLGAAGDARTAVLDAIAHADVSG
jgi:predicted Fe-Mo cluster-binding NifX family protein